MTIDQMRVLVSNAYPSANWKFRVAQMPDKQIYAIYMSFRQRNII